MTDFETASGTTRQRAVARVLGLPLLLALLLSGCGSGTARDEPVRARSFHIGNLVKADVDMVAEVNVQQSIGYLKELARKLYVRNPNQVSRGDSRRASRR